MGPEQPYSTRSDTELILAARSDPAAFEALFDRHAATLRQWLYSRTRDAASAQDLLAETFAQAWRSRRSFKGSEPHAGGAWLYGIARHLVGHHHRRGRVETAGRRRLGMAIGQDEDGGIERALARIDADRLTGAVREAFQTLSEDQRRAIGYRIFDERSYEDVALALDCTPATARTRVFRGLSALRAALERGAAR